MSLQLLSDETGFLHQEVCPHYLLPQPPQAPHQHHLPEDGEEVAEKKERQRQGEEECSAVFSLQSYPNGHTIDESKIQCGFILLIHKHRRAHTLSPVLIQLPQSALSAS